MPRILIVDDEIRITQVFSEAFEGEQGYEIMSANEGGEALVQMELKRPDLIVLDWRLKGEIEGRDVLLCAKNVHHPPVPVFVVTASVHSVKEIESLGADRCLLKPCDNLKAEIKSFFSAFVEAKSQR